MKPNQDCFSSDKLDWLKLLIRPGKGEENNSHRDSPGNGGQISALPGDRVSQQRRLEQHPELGGDPQWNRHQTKGRNEPADIGGSGRR